MAAPRLVVEFDASLIKKGAVEVKKAFADMGVSAEAFERAVEKSVSKNKKLEGSLRSIESRLDPLARATDRYERTVTKLQEGLRRGIIDQDKYNRLLGLAKNELAGTGQAASRASDQILKYAASFLSIQAAINVVRQLMNAQMDLERVQARLRVASGGDSALAANTYKELSTEAKRLGLDLNALANSYSKLAVASRGTSLEGRATKEIFLGVSEASAALGLSADQTEGALRAIEQMMSKGTVQAEELRGQLGERLPGAFNMAAKAMGVTTSELNDMLKRGEVLAVDLLPKLAQELRNTYGEEALTNADRLTGATNNLSTAWTELKNAINEAGLGEEMVETVKLATQALGGLVSVIQTLDGWLTTLGQGSLAQFLSKLTVIGQLKGVIQDVKNLIPGGEGTPTAPSGGQRVNVQPFERYKPAAFDSEAAMQAALKASAKGMEEAEKAADKYANGLEKVAKLQESIADHEAAIAKSRAVLAALPTLDELIAVPDIAVYGPVIQQMSDVEKRAKAWKDEMELVTVALEGTADAAIDAAFGTDQFFDTINQKHVLEAFETELKALEAEFAEFKKEVTENFIRGVQSSLSSFFYEVLDGGEDALKNFGNALKDLLFKTLAEYLAQWAITQAKMLALSLKRIAAEKAATEAAGLGKGSGGGGKGGGIDAGTIAGLGKGSTSSTGGFALSGSAVAGIAAFAVVAALVAYNKHQRSEKDKARYGTFAGVSGYGGSYGSGYQGRLSETGSQIADAMQALTLTIQDASRAFIQGAANAQVNIRNDKKSFQAMVDGELVGTFRTANEAIIAAIKTMFLKKADLDPAIRQVMENYQGTDPEAFGNAIAYVQGILDEIRGVTEIEATLQALPGKIRAMVGELQMLGLEFANAASMAAQWGLGQFRAAWDSISGKERSRSEEMAIRERQKALLLAQMTLERARLAMEINVLKAKAQIARGGAGLARVEIANGNAYLRGRRAQMGNEVNLISTQFDVWNNYIEGRAEFVEAEAGLFAVEIGAMETVLAELDKLIKEVTNTPIRLGGAGKGLDNVIGGGGRFGGGNRLLTALERLISAVDKLREFQKSLAQDEQLSPYGVQQRFGMAQAQFQSVSAAAQQGKVWAIEMLPDVARQYLELASQMYGTAGAGYGGIFEQVNQILQAISDQYPAGTDPQAWMRSGMESVKNYLAMIRGDGRRREEQHDQTNRELKDSRRVQERMLDAIEAQNRSLERAVSTGAVRPGVGGPRTGGGGRVAA